ncbi:MAG: ribosome biogenesis factor YjgA [Pseudomonadales bacterium]|jgi:ribosome-associated protein|nr:ribosome biogenesis factor YjgA [Pseudomonadales bacterium]MDG1444339.1 ribosome biogenesis factor YjgA [Pseudomonadales bacterium]
MKKKNTPTIEDDDWIDWDNLPPSRSQLKRETQATNALGEQLLTIPASQLELLPYPEIIAAIVECKRITKGNARKRQLGYIGKLIRQVEMEPITILLDRFDASSRAHVTHFHQLEVWRDKLVSDDKETMTEILEKYPMIERQQLRQLVRNAVSERQKETQPAVAYRKLFKFLKNSTEPLQSTQ